MNNGKDILRHHHDNHDLFHCLTSDGYHIRGFDGGTDLLCCLAKGLLVVLQYFISKAHCSVVLYGLKMRDELHHMLRG